MSRRKDCDWRAPTTGNRKPKKDCKCIRCDELRTARREKRKVANMTPAQREAKNAAQRVEGISPARRKRRNAAQRVANMTPAEARRARAAGAERSRLYRRRRAEERDA